MVNPKKKTSKPPRPASSTFHYHSYIKDSVAVQRRHNDVNDSEEHEKNPHLQDFLVPHHIGDVKSFEDETSGSSNLGPNGKPTLPRPCVSILHNQECPSRHSCEITESKRHISFHQVTIREYDMVLGDHPNCSYGPPVSLGWHYMEYEPLDVNEYEYHHSRRRPLRQLCLNWYRRMEMLSKDYTEVEIKKATKEKERIMTQRSFTKTFRWAGKAEEVIERAQRKAKKTIVRKSSSSSKKQSTSTSASWRTEDELDYSRSKFTKEKSILKTNVLVQ